MEDNAPAALVPDRTAPDGRPDLAALIGSRICHDLNNPLGAIGNGLELMELAGHKAGPEVALIAQSVAAAKARLQFLRIALGAASPDSRMSGTEVAGIVAAHYGAGRLQIDWPTGLAELPRDAVKRAFLVLMCLETAMPFGGQIAVIPGDEGWRFEASAARMRTLDALWDGATGAVPLTDIGAPLVQFALLPQAAACAGRRVRIETTEGRIIVEV